MIYAMSFTQVDKMLTRPWTVRQILSLTRAIIDQELGITMWETPTDSAVIFTPWKTSQQWKNAGNCLNKRQSIRRCSEGVRFPPKRPPEQTEFFHRVIL